MLLLLPLLGTLAHAADDPLGDVTVTDDLVGTYDLAYVEVPAGRNHGRLHLDVRRHGRGLDLTWTERIDWGKAWSRGSGTVRLDRHLAVRDRASTTTTADGTTQLTVHRAGTRWQLRTSGSDDPVTAEIDVDGIERGGLAVELVVALAVAKRPVGSYGLDALLPPIGERPARWTAVGVRVEPVAPAFELPGHPRAIRVTFTHEDAVDHVLVSPDGGLLGLWTEAVPLLGLACTEQACAQDVPYLGDLEEAAVREAVVTLYAVQLGGRPLADLDGVMDWQALYDAIPSDAPTRPASPEAARAQMHAAIAPAEQPDAVRAAVEHLRDRLVVTVDGDRADVDLPDAGVHLQLARQGEVWRIVRMAQGRPAEP